MTRKTLRELRRAFVRRHRQKLTAVAAAVGLTAAGGGLAIALPAEAASGGTGWGTFAAGSTYSGTFEALGTRAICAEPDINLPVGPSVAQGLQGTAWLNANLRDAAKNRPNLSDNQTAGINRVLSEYANTGDPNIGAALEFAIRAVMYPMDVDLVGGGSHAGSMNAAIVARLSGTGASGADVAATQQNAANLITEINSTTAGSGTSGNPGVPTSILTLISPTSASLTIDFGGADANATWTDTLTNGVFKATGTATMTGTVGSNQQLTLEILPNLTTPGAKLTDVGSVTAPGGAGGYAANLSVFSTTPAGYQQISVGAGAQTPASPSTRPFNDPAGLPTGFAPQVVTNTAANYYVEGDTPTDTVTGVLGDTTPAVTSWPKDSSGTYVPVKVNATLYGPLKTKPTQGAKVPAWTPVAGHGTLTLGGGTSDPLTTAVKVTSDTKIGAAPASSGYYVWVEEISGGDQPAATRTWLIGGDTFTYSADFGIADESFLAPPKVTTSVPATQSGVTTTLNGKAVPTQGLGLPVKDTISVTGTVDASAGMYVIDRHYTFTGTGHGDRGTVTAPTEANMVCTADNLDYTSDKIAITKTGDYTASFPSATVGSGVWVETLYAADGTVLTTKSDQAAACGNTDEWTAVQQLVMTTTAATSGSGTTVDHTTVWGTALPGSQVTWALYDQAGNTAADTDALIGTAGPVGLPGGVLNGYKLTSPAVKFDAGNTRVKYFVESVVDMNGNVYEQGERGVASESLTPTGTHPSTPAPKPTPAAARPLPGISG